MACYTYSLVSVPLYDTLGTEAISYIVEKGKPQQQQHEYLQCCCWRTEGSLICLSVSAASISTIVCDVVEKVNLVLDCVKDKEHTVKNIVLMETPSADLVSRGQQAGIHILSLQEMEVIGLYSFIISLLYVFFFSCFVLFILSLFATSSCSYPVLFFALLAFF